MIRLIIISLLSLVFTSTLSFAEKILWEGSLFCEEISAKSFYVNNEVKNVKLDGEGLNVEFDKDYLKTSYPSLSLETVYEHVVTLKTADQNNNAVVNSQYVAKHGGIFGTKTVTIILQDSIKMIFLISTEPFTEGNEYPAVRTYFHNCRFK